MQYKGEATKQVTKSLNINVFNNMLAASFNNLIMILSQESHPHNLFISNAETLRSALLSLAQKTSTY